MKKCHVSQYDNERCMSDGVEERGDLCVMLPSRPAAEKSNHKKNLHEYSSTLLYLILQTYNNLYFNRVSRQIRNFAVPCWGRRRGSPFAKHSRIITATIKLIIMIRITLLILTLLTIGVMVLITTITNITPAETMLFIHHRASVPMMQQLYDSHRSSVMTVRHQCPIISFGLKVLMGH